MMNVNVDLMEYMSKRASEDMARTIDSEIANMMYMSTTATTASNSINLPINYGGNNMNNYTYPTTTTTTGTHINMGSGSLTTDNTGNLSWNGNQIATYNSKASISRISEMLKDEMMREIILCKTREDCKEKYGSYGLKMFDSMLSEVLQTAIKSEEAFLDQLQKEKDKFEKFKQAVIEKFGDDSKEFSLFLLSTYSPF